MFDIFANFVEVMQRNAQHTFLAGEARSDARLGRQLEVEAGAHEEKRIGWQWVGFFQPEESKLAHRTHHSKRNCKERRLRHHPQMTSCFRLQYDYSIIP